MEVETTLTIQAHRDLKYLRIEPKDANLYEIMVFCGTPLPEIRQEMVYHNEGDPFIMDTSPERLPLMGLDGSYIVKFKDGTLIVLNDYMFSNLFEISPSD